MELRDWFLVTRVTEPCAAALIAKERPDIVSVTTQSQYRAEVILFAAEAILSPQRDELEQGKATLPPALSRLITIRYGLAAGWLMLMLAQPIWLKGIDVVFGGLLLAIVLVAGLVPLGKKADT